MCAIQEPRSPERAYGLVGHLATEQLWVELGLPPSPLWKACHHALLSSPGTQVD